ncbi:MAG TPA: ParB/RepB/Spo0J family partition protein, partial [Chloroflexia bacterium]|nr:ParB/RepB/Spo0J family partition protein [Chloroflexia bacterium]
MGTTHISGQDIPATLPPNNGKQGKNGHSMAEETPAVRVAATEEQPDLAIIFVNPRLLVEDEANERGRISLETDPDLPRLAESIAARGILEPLQVYREPSKWGGGLDLVIRAGHRRRAAAILNNMATVPCVVVPAPKSGLDRAVDRLIHNLQRRDVDDMAKAHTIRALLDDNPDLTQAALASMLGMSQPDLSNYTRLLLLPEAVQGLISDGLLSRGHGIALLRIKGPPIDWEGKVADSVDGFIIKSAATMVDQGYSVRQAEKAVE